MKVFSNKFSYFLVIFFFILTYSQNSFSIEIKGVNIPDTIKLDNKSLILNGTGIRTKFFFKIYIGSLYLKNKESNINKILNDKQAKRISLHFLYKEVNKEKLTTGWTKGFKKNNSDEIFKSLKERLDKFNSYFVTTVKDDIIQLDFLPNNTTRITINNETKGEIAGNDFQIALLKVWLGKKPADSSLKKAMLGKSTN